MTEPKDARSGSLVEQAVGRRLAVVRPDDRQRICDDSKASKGNIVVPTAHIHRRKALRHSSLSMLRGRMPGSRGRDSALAAIR